MRLLATTGVHRPLLIVRQAHYERYHYTHSGRGTTPPAPLMVRLAHHERSDAGAIPFVFLSLPTGRQAERRIWGGAGPA